MIARKGNMTININDLNALLTNAFCSEHISINIESIEKNDQLIPFQIGDKILINLNLRYVR